ncbi:hypothetical protein ACFY12_17675 [Streptomyces sp. NPDC001339]|uniref:hypothetical protein n=1 Tax=Streptomyces sp. NPDC001339 TaxID=3364563 RepID=UPI00367C4BE3
MTEIQFRISQGRIAKGFTALPGYEAWGTLQGTDPGKPGSGAETPLARVHRHSGSDDRNPAFTLTTTAEPAHTLCTITPQAPQAGAADSQTAYAVHDGHGRFIGRIIHGRSPLGIRQAWHIEDAGKQCSAVAYKGTTLGWIAYWAFSPFWAIWALVFLLNGDLRPGGSLWNKPRRARWRLRSGGGARKVALDFRPVWYRTDSELLDVHLSYAQAALYGA